MNLIYYFAALFYVLDVLTAADVQTTATEITQKMQNELSVKGNTCTRFYEETLFLGGSTWTVKCSYYWQKFFKAEASLTKGGPYSPYTIQLTGEETATFITADSSVAHEYYNKNIPIYLKENHDPIISEPDESVATTGVEEPRESVTITEVEEPRESVTITEVEEPRESVTITEVEEPGESVAVTEIDDPLLLAAMSTMGQLPPSLATVTAPAPTRSAVTTRLAPTRSAVTTRLTTTQRPVTTGQPAQRTAVTTRLATTAKVPSNAITVDELKQKMQNELQEKGNTCTPGFRDIITIGDSTFTVECDDEEEKYFKAEAGVFDNDFSPVSVHLLTGGNVVFRKENGVLHSITFARPGSKIYFKENHDPPISEQWPPIHRPPPPPVTVVEAPIKDEPLPIIPRELPPEPERPQPTGRKVKLTNTQLKEKMQNEVQEKGNYCTPGSRDYLSIDGLSFTVECSEKREKYFRAYAGLFESELHWVTVHLLTDTGNVVFRKENGAISGVTFARPGSMVFLTENHDPPISQPPIHTQPPTSETRPPTTEQRPPIRETRPPTTEQRPPIRETRPPTTEQRPPIRETRPPTTEHRPPSTEARPPTEQRPPTSEQRPPTSEQRPPPTEHRPPTTVHPPPVTRPPTHDVSGPSSTGQSRSRTIHVPRRQIVDALLNIHPRGASCDGTLEESITIGSSTYQVHCSTYHLKYIEAYVKAKPSDQFEKYRIIVTQSETLIFTSPHGDTNYDFTLAKNDDVLVQDTTKLQYASNVPYISTENAMKTRPETIARKLMDISMPRDCSNQRLDKQLQRDRFVFDVFCSNTGERYFRAMLALAEGEPMYPSEVTLTSNRALVFRRSDGIFRHLLDKQFMYLMEQTN